MSHWAQNSETLKTRKIKETKEIVFGLQEGIKQDKNKISQLCTTSNLLNETKTNMVLVLWYQKVTYKKVGVINKWGYTTYIQKFRLHAQSLPKQDKTKPTFMAFIHVFILSRNVGYVKWVPKTSRVRILKTCFQFALK